MKALALGVVAVAMLAGCGGGGSSSSSGAPAGSIQVTMTDFKFSPSNITAPHGKVVFWLINASGTSQHDLAIRDSTNNRIAVSELVSAGDTKEFDVANIDAGSYTIYCTQPGHETDGMFGKLTIT